MRRSLVLLLPSLAACQGGLQTTGTREAAETSTGETSAEETSTPDTQETQPYCPVWFADTDGDGWGDANVSVQSCEQPAGHVESDGDCDDADPEAYPDSTRLLDGVDSDCDGQLDWLVDIYVSVDDAFELCVNDEDTILGAGDDWRYGYKFQVWLDSGRHVIGIKGWDLHYSVTAAIAHIEISDGTTWVTDASWKYDPNPSPDVEQLGWCSRGFDDSAWLTAIVHGPIGTAPWNSECGAAPCDFPAASPAEWIWDHFPVELNTQYLRKEIELP